MSHAAPNKIYVMLEKASPMHAALQHCSFSYAMQAVLALCRSCTSMILKPCVTRESPFVLRQRPKRRLGSGSSWQFCWLGVSREGTIKHDHASTVLRFLCIHCVLQPLINRKHCASNTPCVFLLEHLYHGSQLDSTPNEVLESYVSIVIAVP